MPKGGSSQLAAGVLVSQGRQPHRTANHMKVHEMESKHQDGLSKTKESLKKHDQKLKSLKALKAKLLAQMHGAVKPKAKAKQAVDVSKMKARVKKHDQKLKSLRALKAKLLAQMHGAAKP